MIVRLWRGLARPQTAEEYVAHLRTDTIPQLSRIPGFVGVEVLRREQPDGTEFLVATTWESLGAVERFAGTDVTLAVVPEQVQRMMVEFDDRVRHYEVVVAM
jgi:heme-degrading monooxygenase HmoA